MLSLGDDSVWRYLLDIQLNGWNKNVLTFQRGLTEVRRIRLNIGLVVHNCLRLELEFDPTYH